MVIGNNLLSPSSDFSIKIVGFVKMSSYCIFPQCGHSLAFFAFSSICSRIRFCEITVYANSRFLILEKPSRVFCGIFILEQDLHVYNNSLWILSMNAICRTGSASSICQK